MRLPALANDSHAAIDRDARARGAVTAVDLVRELGRAVRARRAARAAGLRRADRVCERTSVVGRQELGDREVVAVTATQGLYAAKRRFASPGRQHIHMYPAPNQPKLRMWFDLTVGGKGPVGITTRFGIAGCGTVTSSKLETPAK